jgi:hypothetical protein
MKNVDRQQRDRERIMSVLTHGRGQRTGPKCTCNRCTRELQYLRERLEADGLELTVCYLHLGHLEAKELPIPTEWQTVADEAAT